MNISIRNMKMQLNLLVHIMMFDNLENLTVKANREKCGSLALMRLYVDIAEQEVENRKKSLVKWRSVAKCYKGLGFVKRHVLK